jgi:hypothetical protein
MKRVLSLFTIGTMVCAIGVVSVLAQDAKKSATAEIPGGIEGQIKSVDKAKQTITITTTKNAEETFDITADTLMFGPRGGKVRSRLNDARFREGLDITVVPDGTKLKELHLGYAARKKAAEPKAKAVDPKTKAVAKAAVTGDAMPEPKPAPATKAKAAMKAADAKAVETADATPAPKATARAARRREREATASTAAAAKVAKAKAEAEEEDDDDDEVPGKVKSFNGRILVVTLANGTNRSFILPNDLKVTVNGTASKTGIKDPAIAEGGAVTVQLEKGGKKVRELDVKAPAATTKTAKKKAA